MPHNVASDQGLHCLLTGFSIKNKKKKKRHKISDTRKITKGLVQHITVEESTSRQWVKGPKMKIAESANSKCWMRGLMMSHLARETTLLNSEYDLVWRKHFLKFCRLQNFLICFSMVKGALVGEWVKH